MHPTELFDWFYRLSAPRKRAVLKAIKVLIAAGYGSPSDCLQLLRDNGNVGLEHR